MTARNFTTKRPSVWWPLALVCLCTAQAREVPLPERYRTQIQAVNKDRSASVQDRAERIRQSYLSYFEPYAVGPDLPVEDLQALFDAAYMMAGYTVHHRQSESPRYIQRMTQALSALRAAGADDEANVRKVYAALVASRRFDEARAMIASERSLSEERIAPIRVPVRFERDRPGYFDVSEGGEVVLRNVPAPSEGVRILVVSGCHFARDAARDITADEALSAAFSRAKALWIAPPDGQFDTDEVRRWNAEFPTARLRIAYLTEPWRGIDFSRIPTIYVLRDGAQLVKLTGWSGSESLEQLRAALRKAELLDDTAAQLREGTDAATARRVAAQRPALPTAHPDARRGSRAAPSPPSP